MAHSLHLKSAAARIRTGVGSVMEAIWRSAIIVAISLQYVNFGDNSGYFVFGLPGPVLRAIYSLTAFMVVSQFLPGFIPQMRPWPTSLLM